ncbi:putative HAD-superfamily hydrolase,subfamily IIIA, polynucleotide kinase 3 phosphatase [Acrodontium crateriforme]|uniref:HAD-superfamily hydrolase,subfamily IIIA, polynucleotide kinase 3 phosphatase n=1 Tax=Acrodontium crateriforme TaxID=150365 RepID=A0AAQ3M4C4_9PEZI|nr:putative HAD-superfamily hydrolase,subfamily IIIA, polynucleotide kinase 3 phosphatase [Acrodontium crateriforme]
MSAIFYCRSSIYTAIRRCSGSSIMLTRSLKRTGSADEDISPPPSKRRVASTTTGNAVANFFKPASKKDPEQVTFKTRHETLLVAQYNKTSGNSNVHPKPPVKIAAFDLDDTLIATKSGNTFSRSPDDWRWWHPIVPSRLQQLHADGFHIIVVTNQGGVKLKTDPKAPNGSMKSVANFKTKVTAVLNSLNLPITLYAATGADMYRKPRTGMWTQMVEDLGMHDNDEALDLEKSVFVGDAAGREGDKAAKIKKDHSCSDRNFATNVGIPFQTPEQFFLDKVVEPYTQSFDPETFLVSADSVETPTVDFKKNHDVELVLFCGSPGSGKSTFYWRQMESLGYARVNQDLLKTRDKCMRAASELLEEGRSVVVDNTNADVETRALWIGLAKKFNVPIRLIHFTCSAKLCEHNDTVRALGGELMNPESRTLLPKMAFTGFTARYREPKIEEGFEDITRVDFLFDGTDEQRAIWRRHWIS